MILTPQGLIEYGRQRVSLEQDMLFGHNLALFPAVFFLVHEQKTLEKFIAHATSYDDKTGDWQRQLYALAEHSGVGFMAAPYLIKAITALGEEGFQVFIENHKDEPLELGSKVNTSSDSDINKDADSLNQINFQLEELTRSLVAAGLSPREIFDTFFV